MLNLDESPGGLDEGMSSEKHDKMGDSEYQHALEVIFDEKNAHRRRSSLVSTDLIEMMSSRKQNTECHIHALLESYRRNSNSSTSSIKGLAKSLTNFHPEPPHIFDERCKVSQQNRVDKEKTENWHGQGNNESNFKELSMSKYDNANSSLCSTKSEQTVLNSREQHALHSRLLSKEQLSEMAWGVRELSKRLGSIRLKLKVKSVFLLIKAHDEALIENARNITKWLLSHEREVPYTIWVEENLKYSKKFDSEGLIADVRASCEQNSDGNHRSVEERLKYWNNDLCRLRPQSFDFVITLGGDGTVLHASWLFQRVVPPVLSFALGSLGFLTKFDYENYQNTLTEVFNEGVTISLRLRFEGTVMRSQEREPIPGITKEKDGADQVGDEIDIRDLVEELVKEEKEDERTHYPDGTYEILNDIVVDRGPNPTMSSIELFSENEHMTTVAADGICVATPTGSTAYNLAAGGSLCHPDNPVILVTAICAHTLSFRPIILPDTMVLRVGVPYDSRSSSWASFDGRERVELRPGDYITISASRYPFASVMHPRRGSEEWIGRISDKLGWNTRQRQKTTKEWKSNTNSL
ncbi:BgTH12-07116 [Blumeria graminis f. sp. triticale]|uniref:BgTH12-07116 n=1 Tax=Blumeria graminis f. sp. triticale TaxID=1689686 RepID=A0A9W4DT54_BLUGR|nr:BgTH12-07116 [Blumeria graminis f. sp. triticale]